jgi:uncharacterized protein (TIGR03437 family)
MNRLAAFAFILISSSAAWAQQFTSGQVSISTAPAVARFAVDGTVYLGAASFVWPIGSKHTLQFFVDSGQTYQTSTDQTAQYSFGGWKDNAGLLTLGNNPIQTVTADPRITSFTATLTIGYLVNVNFFTPPDNLPPGCPTGAIPSNVFRPGVIYIAGQCYWSSVTLFLTAGSQVLNAIPFPGFVFLGWQTSQGSRTPYLTSINITGPISITPTFEPAKRVTFLTNPPGLDVLIDHTSTPTRQATGSCLNQTLPLAAPLTITPLCFGDFDFAPSTNHTIAGVSPQYDLYGKSWVFDSWSNGESQNAILALDSSTTALALTANFVPGVQASFVTTPTGLKLSVDGRVNWPSYNFVWGQGTTHQVSAPAQDSDSKGRKYTFQNWSNGGATAQSITLDANAAANGVRMVASYAVLSRVLLQTLPPGLPVKVNGSACQTPCTLDVPNGTQIALSATQSIPTGSGARLDLTGWSDGAASDHTFTVKADYTSITASYSSSYLISTGSNPAAGAQFGFSPGSPDNFYQANTTVTVTANPMPGFEFVRWNGDLTGTYPTGYLTVTRPVNVMALLSRIPYIAPAGVGNAAGTTPVKGVAPGSLISIAGQSLSGSSETGPLNPLSQSLAGVSVLLGDRLLPLVSVTPTLIVAQIFSDLTDGDYTLTVVSVGQPDVSGTFTIVRNAPGLLTRPGTTPAIALALHEDGTPITSASPALPGELVSVFGTGFGPYTRTVVDGFQVPSNPPALTDPVQVTVGNATVVPDSTSAASGYVGYAVTRFRITGDMPSGTNASLTIQVNNQQSNTVLLPLQ